MEESSKIGLKAASLLLDAGCVTMCADEPFRLPSGWASPAYIDCRFLVSLPAVRCEFVDICHSRLEGAGISKVIDGMAACETSGIPLGSWLADRSNIPLHIVRKVPRGNRRVDGIVSVGHNLLLVDDVMAAGISKLNFIQALESTGVEVSHLLVIFNYATFGAESQLSERGVRTHSLTNWKNVWQVAKQRDLFNSRSLSDLEDFLSDPPGWSHCHGGRCV